MGEHIEMQKDQRAKPFAQTFFHGTKANLIAGDLIVTGINSNYGKQKNAKYIYLTSTLDAAIWGAELAIGDNKPRIYLVEPTGEIEDDPNLTDQKFPGNPSMSYRSKHPFRVLAEVTGWIGHPKEIIAQMRSSLDDLNAKGIEAIE